MKAKSLLDPRFVYVPSNATDVTRTWRRFGFDPRRNAEQRERLKRRLPELRQSHPLLKAA